VGISHLDDATAQQGDELLVSQLGQQRRPRRSIQEFARASGVRMASRPCAGGQ
jgi:hypothetical protein